LAKKSENPLLLLKSIQKFPDGRFISTPAANGFRSSRSTEIFNTVAAHKEISRLAPVKMNHNVVK
jgi:hypothetical protein